MEKFDSFLNKQTETNNWQEQLAGLWQKFEPEILELQTEQLKALKRNVAKREKIIKDSELLNVLKDYGIDLSQLDIKKDGQYYKLKVKEHFNDNRLPEGYGYKGGAARALLLRNLGITEADPRDVDVVRLVDSEPYPNADTDIAKKFMPDDFEHGYGVEYLEDKDKYFATRDFTLNEILADDKEILTSRQCLLDTVRRIIRLTHYERERYDDDKINHKMLSKALRFYSEAINRYGDAQLENINDYEYERYFINPFWLALQLDRAFEQSSAVAEQFTEELKNKEQLPLSINSAAEAAEYLRNIMRDSDNFYYRHAPVEQFKQEYAWLDDKFENLPKFSSHSRS